MDNLQSIIIESVSEMNAERMACFKQSIRSRIEAIAAAQKRIESLQKEIEQHKKSMRETSVELLKQDDFEI